MGSHHATLLWLLTFLFSMRVSGQAVQHWIPQTFLPAFNVFQGSNLPYWLLLSSQILILAFMLQFSWRVQKRTLRPHRATGSLLKWIGWAYMLFSLGRIVIGATLPGAPSWFSAWIPAFFHVLLAGFVLTIASYHLHLIRSGEHQR